MLEMLQAFGANWKRRGSLFVLKTCRLTMAHTISDKQNSRAFQELFNDKLQFLRSKISSETRLSLTPFEHLMAKTLSAVICDFSYVSHS